MPPLRQRRALLLAMSGVRVVNPELRALGLTLPGFVDRGEVIASLPSLGLLTLAAHSPPHWDVAYRELDALAPADLDAIERERFDVVAISSLSARVDDAYAIAGRLRAAGTAVVLAGLPGYAVVVGSLLPLALVVVTLTVLNLEHVMFDLMAGIRPEQRSSADTAYQVLFVLTAFSAMALPVLVLGYLVLVVLRWRAARRAASPIEPSGDRPPGPLPAPTTNRDPRTDRAAR